MYVKVMHMPRWERWSNLFAIMFLYKYDRYSIYSLMRLYEITVELFTSDLTSLNIICTEYNPHNFYCLYNE